MQSKHVGYQALGGLRPATQVTIQRTIQTAQWTPAQRQAHAHSMQRLQQTALRFAQMQPKAPAPSAPQAAPRHNSVAQSRYHQGKPSPSHVPAYANVAAARQRNMQRTERTAARQAFRQQVAATGQNAMRALGNWVRQQRPLQAIQNTLTAQRQKVQQQIAQRGAQMRAPQQRQRKEPSRGQDRTR